MHRVSGTVLRGLDGIAGVPDAVRAALGASGATGRRCTTSSSSAR